MNRWRNLLLLSLCVFLPACSIPGCVVGAEFKLAPESRLPVWFSVPEGRSRDELVIELTLYAVGSDKLVMLDKNNEILEEVSVETRSLNGSGPYPHYVVMSVGAVSEIIEHRGMEPIFYVSDDPDVLKKFEPRQ